MPMARKTKIVATLGPACRDEGVLEAMLEAGMDVARVNASHASAETIREEVETLRRTTGRLGREVGIILDLMGPKVRVGEMEGGGAELVAGSEFALVAQPLIGDSSRASVSNADVPAALRPGDTVLLDDGAIRLRVLEAGEGEARCVVEDGGILRSHKGVNLPGIRLDTPSLTQKDIADLELGVELGVDWMALSFVQSSRDVARLRTAIAGKGSDIPIIAKIEKSGAVAEIEAVVEEADAVMVARGDLGVEMPLEEIPIIQKKIIEVASRRGKPVITATQMLQSMIENPSPTRAEVNDVANAVFDGTDAVMLSGETAVGSWPVETVDTMRRIISRAETVLPHDAWLEERRRWIDTGTVEAVCFAACELARQTEAAAIVAPTESGFTACQMSRFRPRQPILALTPEVKVERRLYLFWGVLPRLVGVRGSVDEMFAFSEQVARREGFLEAGKTLVITAGVKAPGEKGLPTTNTIHCVSG